MIRPTGDFRHCRGAGRVTVIVTSYLVGHAGLALLHQATGHPVLQRMFGRGIGEQGPA